MANFLPPAVFEIKAIADQAIAKFKEVDGELDKMGKKADDAGGKISGLDKASKIATAGILAMGAAFVGFAAFGIKEANEAEQALNKLGVTLSNFGVNTAETRKKVEELTGSYVDLGFGGEEAAAGFDVLFRATGDLDKAQALLATSADLARVKNISLADASSIVAKASQGGAKAFKEMGITLDTTLPKAQAIDKAMAELNARIGGQATAYTKTFAGQMVVMKEKFADVAETLGTTLLPYLKSFLDGIIKTVNWIKANSSWLSILAGTIITVTVALAAYNATLKVVAVATKVWGVTSAVVSAIIKGVTTGQWGLNAALNANPIGLVVAGLVLLAGAFVIAWNKSETFRKAMVKVFQVVVNGVGYLVGAIAKLLEAASKIPGIGKKFEGPAKALNSVANDVRKFSDGLDKLANKKIDIKFSTPKIPGMPNTGGASTGGASGAGNAAVKKANEGYMKIVKEANDKINAARTAFNEEMAELEKDYNKTTSKLRADAGEKIASLTKNHNEKVAKLEADAKKKTVEATNKFNETVTELTIKKGEDLLKAEKDNLEKVAEITKQGNEKLQSIVESSVNRLRDAYKKGTAFSVTDLFKGLSEAGTASVDNLLTKMKEKLSASKELAKNAALLQAKGFSQTFIEEVVAAGPDVGNQLAKSIMDANPETIKELQATYADIEATTDTGLDALAKAMNAGGRLATAELNKAYAQAQVDLQQSLAKQAAEYTEQQAEINKTFNQAMADAEKTRNSAIASALADLAEALAEENKQFNEAVAEVNSELTKALAEAQADFVEKSEAARKKLNDTLAEIEKDFKEKLGKITDATKATTKAIMDMLANFNNAKAIMMTPIVIPAPIYATPTVTTTTPTTTTTGKTGTTAVTNISTQVTANTNASPAAIATSVTNAIKLGTSGGYTYTNTSVGARDK